MPIEPVCSSNGETPEADGVVNLIAAHRRAMAEVECLGNRVMHAEEAEAELISPRLDAVMKKETAIRRQAAMAPVADVGELKNEGQIFRAAHLPSELARGWRPLRIRGYSLTRSAGM
ncbi:MAG: hypothetical protein EOR68_26195 [Mesorhizobium sp.]|uniref:hypothetical protein n=1 Tax=Mesorhizobium sp. TaxID=1871066 RepID=UPI000FE68A5A|nr:hypothetical protein [Mesorhizobium sp.]RWL92529.1 MAG: hypothetical protein EOR68_26195 [Mesorhizobium sp.]TIP40229.1 MAG: hypothetical protein E5X77_28225 [Mesorhizobium sp.]TJV68149.1 MAG: hypothetical protein E5X76_30810 [Mesorhizobium sp.]